MKSANVEDKLDILKLMKQDLLSPITEHYGIGKSTVGAIKRTTVSWKVFIKKTEDMGMKKASEKVW